MNLRIATRKSALAMAQTKMAADAIVAANKVSQDDSGLTYELVSMTTEGDRRLDKSLASFGGKGVFIKELEIALLEKRADIAIHSLKDMPAEVLPEFKLAAVLKREDPRDAFLARGGVSGMHFMDLPAGSKIGTGSIRRIVQLKALRPDLEYVPIRGNIQTRISKLTELDGVILAAAGLKRMGLADQVTEYFSTDQMLPASGQGILAIETLNNQHQGYGSIKDDHSSGCHCESQSAEAIEAILSRANDKATYCIAVAEMAYLKALDAGCQFPVASFAEFAEVPTGKNEFSSTGKKDCPAGKNEPISTGGKDSSISEKVSCSCRQTGMIMKIRGIYWDEPSKRLLRAEDSCSIEVSSSDAQACAHALGVSLAQKIKAQL